MNKIAKIGLTAIISAALSFTYISYDTYKPYREIKDKNIDSMNVLRKKLEQTSINIDFLTKEIQLQNKTLESEIETRIMNYRGIIASKDKIAYLDSTLQLALQERSGIERNELYIKAVDLNERFKAYLILGTTIPATILIAGVSLIVYAGRKNKKSTPHPKSL
jgi:hypothetical protein